MDVNIQDLTYTFAPERREVSAKVALKGVGMISALDIIFAYDNPEWCGFGYLGERRTTGRIEHDSFDQISVSDEFLVAQANKRGWGKEYFFHFLNSTCGRHFADMSLSTESLVYNETNIKHLNGELDYFETWMHKKQPETDK
jgi:hypothetical protein